MGVTPQDWAISAMVNWRALYMRWALLMRDGVVVGLRPPVRPRAASRAGLGAFGDEGGFVLGHEGEHAEDKAAVGGGGVHDAVGQRPHPDTAGLQLRVLVGGRRPVRTRICRPRPHLYRNPYQPGCGVGLNMWRVSREG